MCHTALPSLNLRLHHVIGDTVTSVNSHSTPKLLLKQTRSNPVDTLVVIVGAVNAYS